jgi:hypothetical protein
MGCAYHVPTFVFFEVNEHFAPSQKYVQTNKNNEIISKNIFYLAINIVRNKFHFHFIL